VPRPRKDGTLQRELPLLTWAEKVERRAYYELTRGKPLGRHRRRRQEKGEFDKPRGQYLAAIESAAEAAREASEDRDLSSPVPA